MKEFDIYYPEEDSYLLEQAVKKYAKGAVLDIGTGSGIQAIAAAQSNKVSKVVAADVNLDAISYVKNQIKKIKTEIKSKKTIRPNSQFGGWSWETNQEHKLIEKIIQKISVKKSDLFSAFKDEKNKSETKKSKSLQFDTIIFNPPYLPFDRRETGGIAKANSGGKHGYELLVKFIEQANEFLKTDGCILTVFSTLTKKEKIDEAIEKNLLEKQVLSEKPMFMERLFVYKIKKSIMLQEIERKKISKISYLSGGQRGIVFTGKYKGKNTAIKIKKPSSVKDNTIEREAYWLKRLHKKINTPKLYFSTHNICCMEFIEGQQITEYFQNNKKDKIKKVIATILNDLYFLDANKINKEEMNHPLKHIIVKKDIPYLIDFERAHFSIQGKNINQFLDFLSSKHISDILNEKGFKINKDEFIALGKKYSVQGKESNVKEIVKEILKKLDN